MKHRHILKQKTSHHTAHAATVPRKLPQHRRHIHPIRSPPSLLETKGIATRNKNVTSNKNATNGAPGLTTRSKNSTRNKGIATSNKCIATRSKEATSIDPARRSKAGRSEGNGTGGRGRRSGLESIEATQLAADRIVAFLLLPHPSRARARKKVLVAFCFDFK